MDIRSARHFLILGAAKCGTTSLYGYVGQHPDVFFSTPKEPVFFEAEYEQGMDYYWSRYFAGWQGEPAAGEARTHNLMLPFVAPRIREALPEARLIALLRNPVDRAYSHWWHRFSRQLEPLSFPDAIRANLERIRSGLSFEGPRGARLWRQGLVPPSLRSTRYGLYLELGYYAGQIRRYLDLFPASRMKIVFFDDLSRSPLETTREVWRFLGVDDDRTLEDEDPRNAANPRAWSPGVARLRRILATAARLPGWGAARRTVPSRLRGRLRGYLAGRPAVRPSIDAETESWLIEHFAPHNRDLESLTGRSLEGWSTPRRERRSTRAAEAGDAPSPSPQ